MHRCPVRTRGCCMLPVRSAALLLATSDMTLQPVSWAANLDLEQAACCLCRQPLHTQPAVLCSTTLLFRSWLPLACRRLLLCSMPSPSSHKQAA